MAGAYQLADLVAKLKEHGLDIAEDGAKLVVGSVFDWVSESALVSENKVDDFAAVILPAVKPFVFSQLDKIDGKPN